MRASWLRNQYWQQDKSTGVIAKECGTTPLMVYLRMKEAGIPRRTLSYAMHLAKGNHVALSPEAITFLSGELLGDGSLQNISTYSARYQHGNKHRDYIAWLSKTLLAFGIEGTIGSKMITLKNGKQSPMFYYSGKSYAELQGLYNHWYPDRTKHIPNKLEVKPIMLRQHFLGDGSARATKHHGIRIELATCGFHIDEVKTLANKIALVLNVLPAKIKVHNYHNYPRITIHDPPIVRAFYDYIGPCPKGIEHVYGYKWDVRQIVEEAKKDEDQN